MTEQKATRILKEEMGWESDSGKIQAFAMAISALEEIQQYREIEKRLEDMYGGQLPLAAYVDVLEYALKEPGKPHPVNARILTYEDADAWEAYKAIGTPKKILRLFESGADTLEKSKIVIDSIMKEMEEYRAIGTVDECREAVEKQRAEKPTVSVQEKDLKVGCAVFAAGTKTFWCPNCRKAITGADKHCRTCGKKIDWGEEE